MAVLFLSLLPIGVIQGWAAVSVGLWYARSVEVVQSPLVRTLVWMRVPGDIVFGLGALLIAVFVCKLWLGSLGRVPPAFSTVTPGGPAVARGRGKRSTDPPPEPAARRGCSDQAYRVNGSALLPAHREEGSP